MIKETPLGPVGETERGFEIIRFDDRYHKPCELQQSSLADCEPPGSSAVWLGPAGGHRMHLDLTQVKALICVLEFWVQFGEFGEDPTSQYSASFSGSTRAGFTGEKGDRATISITDNGDGISLEAWLSHPPHPRESDETATEAAADIMMKAIGKPTWKQALAPGGITQ